MQASLRPLGFGVVAAVGLITPPATAQLAAHGPTTSYGYPDTYTDQAGLSLVHGTDLKDPLLLAIDEVPFLLDPDGPLDVAAGNFLGESFYWAGESSIPTAGGEALLVMAIEGVFGGPDEEILEGDQLVFSRIRIRVDVGNDPDNAGTYTITHPFGTETFEVSAELIEKEKGNRVINFTDDCLHTAVISCAAPGPTAFTSPLDPSVASISHFLRWDSDAPEGYVGDPAIPHTVTGSPTGNNLFRVEGPNIAVLPLTSGDGLAGSTATDGGGGRSGGIREGSDPDMIETDLFSVSGKLADPPVIGAFLDLGFSLVGTAGVAPALGGTGPMTPGAPYSIQLRGAVASAKSVLFASFDQAQVPFAGGVIIPDLSTGAERPLMTEADGTIVFQGTTPNLLPGTQIFLQVVVTDPGAAHGFASSNALQATIQ